MSGGACFVGVDGCRAGWIAVVRRPGVAPELLVDSAFAALVGRLPRRAVVAVDMPIGLPDEARRGGRACDLAARVLLGPARGRSVFSPPVRAALAARSYAEALTIQRGSSADAVGLSLQAWHLVPRIAELDRFVTPARQRWICEAHPEVAFARLAGRPMATAKRSLNGREERLAVLSARGWRGGMREIAAWSAPGVARDDVVDAAALALTAEGIADGGALRLPGDPPRDARGLRMEIRG